MKLVNIGKSIIENAALESDYSEAESIGRFRFGKLCLYFAQTFRIGYVSYRELDRAFLRVATSVSRVCGGTSELKEYRLVLCTQEKELLELQLISEKKAHRILEVLRQHGVEIGKTGSKEHEN